MDLPAWMIFFHVEAVISPLDLFCYNLKTLAQKFRLSAFMPLDIELAINQTIDVNRGFKQKDLGQRGTQTWD